MKNKTLIVSIIAMIILVGGVVVYSQTATKQLPASMSGVQSHRIYSLKSDSQNKTYFVGKPNEYSFHVVDEQGNTLKDYMVTHTKQMHVIVVRKDLSFFQHVHPQFDQTTGTFTFSDLTFPIDGEYRIFADFAPTGGQMDAMSMPLGVTLFEDVAVGNVANYKAQPLGTEETSKTFDGLRVTLATHGTPMSGAESMLMFSLTQNGKPVTDLEPYLGALGHSVILREGTLDFIHAHPIEDAANPQTGLVDFMVYFPEAGKYKVFTQFQRGGKVITTDFVITVAQGATDSTDSMQGMNMQNSEHSNH